MQQTLILGLVLVVVLGAGYWLFTHGTAGTPVPEAANTTEEPAAPTANDYTGMTEVQAEALATQNGVLFRVVERDGEELATTRDYREGRINAVVEDEVVVSYTVEGAGTEAESESGDESEAGGVGDMVGDVEAPTGDEVSEDHDAIIGLTEAEAEAYAETNGVQFRIGSIDGEPQPVTMDYRPGRITASVEGGIVTDYSVE